MKLRILFLAALLSFSGIALAQHRGHGHHGHHGHNGGGWVAPFIVGAGITYILTRPTPVYVDRPVVNYYTPGGYPPIVYGPAAAPVAYWYYCPDAQAYHPYVTTCPSPWMLVTPR